MKTLIVFLTFLFGGLASAQSPVWDTQHIVWQQINPDGSKYAVLEGDRSKPGPFTYAFYLPDGVWVASHVHSGTARVVVLRGVLLLGDGSVPDHSKARAIGPGGYFLVKENAPHWEGARGDTVILGVGIGPWKTTELTPRK